MRALTLALLVLGAACASCGDSVVSPTDTGTGTLNLFLSDSSVTDARALLVTFSEVTAHRGADGDPTRIPFGNATSVMRTCDLKRLEGMQDLLGVGPLTAGQYTQLRIVIAGAALYFDNASEGPPCADTIRAPAGRRSVVEVQPSEVRLDQAFGIVTGANTVIVLDFAGGNSVADIGNGQYRMTPTIGVVSVN